MNELRLKYKCTTALLASCAILGGIYLFSPVNAQHTLNGVVISHVPFRLSEPSDVAQSDLSSIQALDIALAEIKEALSDVELNLRHASRRIDKASLISAKKKLLETIDTLEWQRQNVLSHRVKLEAIEETVAAKRVEVEATRRAISEQVVEKLNNQKTELSEVRERILEELIVTREQLATEIQELQQQLNEHDDGHSVRLRALREAEIAIADMERHHLDAIKTAEIELQRARQMIEAKIKLQGETPLKMKQQSARAEN